MTPSSTASSDAPNHRHAAATIGARARHDFAVADTAVVRFPKGLSREVVAKISAIKNEPQWMRAARMTAYDTFAKKPLPTWGPDLRGIDFNDITYFARATDAPATAWDDLPEEIRHIYDRIGIPQHEKDWLAGVSAQYESEAVYTSMMKEIEAQGVIFCDMDMAVRNHGDLVKKYFGTLVPAANNTFAALNTAVWSGGSFLYVPTGVRVTMPVQAYFRINAERFGQFERTLIIAEPGATVHYVEGCTAPTYSTNSLHAAVVEIFAHRDATVRYTTIQNWSTNIFNLVTKRARADARATVEWIDCNIGSGVTMKYPAVILAGERARGSVISLAIANGAQHIDAGAKMIHRAPHTSSHIMSKSICGGGGTSTYRGLIDVSRSATDAVSFTRCDALLLDDCSRSNTYPTAITECATAHVAHEASVENVDADMLLYAMSRGLNEVAARSMIVNGFVGDITKEIPLEYAVELQRLIYMEMENAVG